MKTLLIILFSLSLLTSAGMFAEAQSSLNCPTGSYYGKDNWGNKACRDIETNKVVKGIPKTQTDQKLETIENKQTDSCENSFEPGCIELPPTDFSNNSILLLIVVVVVIVIMVSLIATRRKNTSSTTKSTENVSQTPTYVQPSHEPASDDRMIWTCSSCKQKFTDRQSYISHPCHFR